MKLQMKSFSEGPTCSRHLNRQICLVASLCRFNSYKMYHNRAKIVATTISGSLTLLKGLRSSYSSNWYRQTVSLVISRSHQVMSSSKRISSLTLLVTLCSTRIPQPSLFRELHQPKLNQDKLRLLLLPVIIDKSVLINNTKHRHNSIVDRKLAEPTTFRW